MPLYEYECRACKRRTEKIQKFSDPELTVCPFCGGELARTLTAPAVHFSGGGWYKDGYASAKPAAANSEGAAAPAASGSTGADSSSSTPASSAPAAAPASTPSAPATSKT